MAINTRNANLFAFEHGGAGLGQQSGAHEEDQYL
jgi:hypothetical protein